MPHGKTFQFEHNVEGLASFLSYVQDLADAYQLGELFYKEELEPYRKRGKFMMNLRYLTRQHESLTDMYVQAKLQFQASHWNFSLTFFFSTKSTSQP
jgi:hypothetical protein